jgi:hypothetical protein
VWVPCDLPGDGPVTLAVDTLGVVDLWVADVSLVRRPRP